jgi:hypothetical protein
LSVRLAEQSLDIETIELQIRRGIAHATHNRPGGTVLARDISIGNPRLITRADGRREE